MSETPVPEVDEIDEDDHAPVPEPPRRVPFGVALTATLLGVVTLTTLLVVALTTDALVNSDSIGESLGWGLLMAAGAVGAALTAAVAWSFTRNGKTIGVQVIGGLVVLAGLAALINGVTKEDEPAGVGTGMLYLVLGLSLIVVPLLGDAPIYLAARRVWSDAERDWLRSLVTPDAPPALPFQHQPWPAPPQQHQPWPAQPPQHQPWPTQQQPWAAPAQAAQPQYQYPPQQPSQAWAAPHPQQYQAWPEAPAAGPAWSAQQPPTYPASAPPVSAQPATGYPASPPQPDPSVPQPAAQQAPTESIHAHPTPPPPRPAAQQAPTEQIQSAPQHPTPPTEPQEPTEPRPQT